MVGSGIRYVLGLGGGYVIRKETYIGSWLFEMGDYIDVDWHFFTEKVLSEVFFRLIMRLNDIYMGGNFLIYGIEDKVYLCVDYHGKGPQYEVLKRLYMVNGDEKSLEVVNYESRGYYKYEIKDVESFGDILDLLGI